MDQPDGHADAGTQRAVLVVEDNADLADLLKIHLQDLGCEVEVACDGTAGLRMARDGRYDLIILDLMLPGMDGIELCKHIRTAHDYVPILMLTARSAEIDRVLGLEVGADDYLTKPFSIRELLARVKALFRRVDAMARDPAAGTETCLQRGDLLIDTARHAVTLKGKRVELTAKEFDLLTRLAQLPGRVFSRQQLLDQVWGYSHEGYEHTVNSHINRLRAKIEDNPAQPRYILTVWGVGYKFYEPSAPESEAGR